jgi:hypothetical protein
MDHLIDPLQKKINATLIEPFTINEYFGRDLI